MLRSRLLIALVAAPVLVFVAAGCGGKKESAPASQPTTGAASQPTASRPSGGDSGSANELANVVQNFGKAKSFRAKMTIEQPGQPKQEGEMEVVLPDQIHFF